MEQDEYEARMDRLQRQRFEQPHLADKIDEATEAADLRHFDAMMDVSLHPATLLRGRSETELSEKEQASYAAALARQRYVLRQFIECLEDYLCGDTM